MDCWRSIAGEESAAAEETAAAERVDQSGESMLPELDLPTNVQHSRCSTKSFRSQPDHAYEAGLVRCLWTHEANLRSDGRESTRRQREV